MISNSRDTLLCHALPDLAHLDGGVATAAGDVGAPYLVHHQQDRSRPSVEARWDRRGSREALNFSLSLTGHYEVAGHPSHGTDNLRWLVLANVCYETLGVREEV